MFAVIGFIAITIIWAYVAGVCGMLAMMMLGGFDEYKPLAGTVMAFITLGIVVAWWFVMGTHIHLSIAT